MAEPNDKDDAAQSPGEPSPPRRTALLGSSPEKTPGAPRPAPPRVQPKPSLPPRRAGTLSAGTPAAAGSAPRAARPATTPPPPPAAPSAGSTPVAPTPVADTIRPEAPPAEHPEKPADPSSLEAQLQRRAAHLKSGDPVAAARALVELGLYQERVAEDRDAARAAYEAARGLVRTLEPALVRVRRMLDHRKDLPKAINIIDDELAIADNDAQKADLLAERARLCCTLGRMDQGRACYAEALRLVPRHAASLRGLELTLRQELGRKRDGTNDALDAELASHLERLADAYAPQSAESDDGDARLAAWIHVERAKLLDERLQKTELATAALERAVAFAPSPGPVRDALGRHLVRHQKFSAHVEALSVEAEHERDDERAARLLYTAARTLVDTVGGRADAQTERAAMAQSAIQLLTRAAARASHNTATAQRILTELVRLAESTGDLETASAVRVKRLPLLEDPETIAHEHVRLSEIFESMGRAEPAAQHAQLALRNDPDDQATRHRLDRALAQLGRHEERVRSWVAEANTERPTRERVAALLTAAEIAEQKLRLRDEAIAHLRTAWVLDPGNGLVFDALSALLAPPRRDEAADLRGVRARIELYVQAAQAASDPARKIGLLEKLAFIWEDELGQPARAIEELDKILAIEPARRTALLALQRNAERAGDHERLARALVAEADLTEDPTLRRKLLLRATEVTSERLGDRDRAFDLIERAIAVEPVSVEALRARYRLDDKHARYEDARRTLLALIGREPDDARRFALWVEIALLDEHRLRHPFAAVEAYTQAALLKPQNPLPQREIVRLLRDSGAPEKLVAALMQLAAAAPDADTYARLLFQTAEVHELILRDDAAALKCLAQADALAEAQTGPAVLEAMERIYVRTGASAERVTLYSRWLERKPPAAVDHGLRIALAEVLSQKSPAQAIELLEGLVSVVPGHVPALRLLEHLHRGAGAAAGLANTLRAEAEVFRSGIARAGALWELVTLDEQIGAGTTLDALSRITADMPHDSAALDAIVRVAGKIVTGVGVPHPAALATRARLVPAIRARKELARDPIARAVYQLEEALLTEAQAPDDPAKQRAALAGYRATLTLWPESLLAARGLERLAERLGDRQNAIFSQLMLAKLAQDDRERATHLVRAAELTREDNQAKAQSDALALYEDALRADADCAPAAQSLARLLAADVHRLVDRLGSALERARDREQIILLGSEIGLSILRNREAALKAPSVVIGGGPAPLDPPDPGLGLTAMRQVLAVAPDEVPALLIMARLLHAQRVWADARDVLLRVVELSKEPDATTNAHFMLAELYEGPLSDLGLAQSSLQAILALDEKNTRALEQLHRVALERGDHILAKSTLGRMADLATDPAARVEIDLRLAELCREAGDAQGCVRALCDAIATAPNDMRPFSALARLYRIDTPDGAASYASALQQVIEIAGARRLPVDYRWLSTLGLLEITVLIRPRDGIAHLQQGVALPCAPPEARVALGRGLEAAGRNGEAAQVLRDVLVHEPEIFARLGDLGVALVALEAALAKEGRADERTAVEEVRACLGDVKPDRLARLRGRRLPEQSPYAGAFTGAERARLLLPEARSPLIDVGLVMAPIAAKILRFDLASLGIGSRDRISPRDGHPARALAERFARALGIESFELYLSPAWQGAMRVYPGDPPLIVASTSFLEFPEAEKAFALARLMSRMALGLTWLDEIPIEALDGFFLATIRALEPSFGSGEIGAARESMAQSFLLAVQKAIGRRQRKQLEELMPSLSAAYDARAFSIAIRRSEYRMAYVLAGDLIAGIDYLRRYDREIARSNEDPRILLQHPVTNEMLRYALTAEAAAERRRAGSIVG